MAAKGPLSNQQLGDKYLLGNLLGQGGFGVVYAAKHMLLNREQAIKILLEQHFTNLEFRDRFIREARTLATLDHRNIVHVDDFGFDGNRAYLVMPYIRGGTLHTILREQGPLAVGDVEYYLEQICAALGYAHARNVAHLDLKPPNLLMSADKQVFLSDFGLAHLLEQGLVKGGASLEFGTPQYMAPEHARGQPELRSDLYSLGILLYEMLTGKLPFEGESLLALRYKHEQEPPPPLRTIRPELPEELEAVMAKTLAKQSKDRYQTVEELLAAFKAALLKHASKAFTERRGESMTTVVTPSDEEPVLWVLSKPEHEPITSPPPTSDNPMDAATATAALLHTLHALKEALRAARAVLDVFNDPSKAPPEEDQPSHLAGSNQLSTPSKTLREDNPLLSAWRSEQSTTNKHRVASLLVFQFLVLLSGVVGIASFFFLPWLDLQTGALTMLTTRPSGFSLAQSWNLGWLLWLEPIGAAYLIALAGLRIWRLMQHAPARHWSKRLIVSTSLFSLMVLALSLFFSLALLLTGIFYRGSHYGLASLDSGFWLGSLSLTTGLLAAAS
jgi:serine/threonine protein kinase